jgi:hypothetical protein
MVGFFEEKEARKLELVLGSEKVWGGRFIVLIENLTKRGAL